MELKTLKALALTSATVIGLAMAGPAYAQTETVTVTLITASGITSAVGTNADFGSYVIQNSAPDTVVLQMSTDGTDTINVTGVIDPTTQIIPFAGTPAEALVTVQAPAPATLQMDISAVTDFGDANLALTGLDWETASESGTFVIPTPFVAPAAQSISVLAASTDENVVFGPEITASGTPLDNTHVADFTVNFAF